MSDCNFYSVKSLVESVVPEARLESFSVLCRERVVLTDSTEVGMRLRSVGPCAGWWETTREYGEMLVPGIIALPHEPLISAELVAGKISWSLRQEDESWVLRRFERVEGVGIGIVRSFLVEGHPSLIVEYEESWQVKADHWASGVLLPTAARLRGFTRQGGAS